MILCLIISYYDEYEIDMTLITKNNASSKSMNDYIRFAMLEWNISYISAPIYTPPLSKTAKQFVEAVYL
jgi:hypothetical protein